MFKDLPEAQTHFADDATIKRMLELELHNTRLKDALAFYGIEFLLDGSTQFKPATMDKWRRSQNNTENGKLIAAAPDLLAALEAMLVAYPGATMLDQIKAQDSGYKAIRKAKGEA